MKNRLERLLLAILQTLNTAHPLHSRQQKNAATAVSFTHLCENRKDSLSQSQPIIGKYGKVPEIDIKIIDQVYYRARVQRSYLTA